MIRAVIVEDEPLAAQFLATLLENTGRVLVVGRAADGLAGMPLCVDTSPQVAFLDIQMPGSDGMALAAHLMTLPRPPLLVFVTGYANHAPEAFRVEAVDYLLKPLDEARVAEAVGRVARRLAPPKEKKGETPASPFAGLERLPVKGGNSDVIHLLARETIVAALHHDRRTFVHTEQSEFATYYPLSPLTAWLGTPPFVQIARDAVVNLHHVREIIHYGDRLYQVALRDRAGTVVEASRNGAARLAAHLRTPF